MELELQRSRMAGCHYPASLSRHGDGGSTVHVRLHADVQPALLARHPPCKWSLRVPLIIDKACPPAMMIGACYCHHLVVMPLQSYTLHGAYTMWKQVAQLRQADPNMPLPTIQDPLLHVLCGKLNGQDGRFQVLHMAVCRRG